MSKKHKFGRESADVVVTAETVTPEPQNIDAAVSSEPQSVDVETLPLNLEGYTCKQTKTWVLEKAVLKVGLLGVKNKAEFYARVKAEMDVAGVTTYQSSRYRGMTITAEKVKQRVDYVVQNIGSKNKEHRWRLVDVINTDAEIRFVTQKIVPNFVKVENIAQ